MNQSTLSSIEVDGLVVDFALDNAMFNRRFMRAVNDVSFSIKAGEALAIVGESGSGKSTCARALCGLYAPNSGDIQINGQKVSVKDTTEGKRQLAKTVQMIFQDPFSSLNPVHTIRHHLQRPIRVHHPDMQEDEVERQLISALEKVGLTPADTTADKYPHELSGGQRQRVAIARALAVGAPFILADEPISMLDVSIRLGILNLMSDMKAEGIGFLYITHDIATARYFAERTAVMYVGHMVEWGNSDEVTQKPQHPYTQLLIQSVPESRQAKRVLTEVIKADNPLWTPESKGCPFRARCPKAVSQCESEMPAVKAISEDHFVRCHAV